MIFSICLIICYNIFAMIYVLSRELDCGDKICNPLKVKTVPEALHLFIEVLLFVSTPIIVLFVVYTGFLFVMSRGEPNQLQKARSALLWAIIGGGVILGAWVLLEIAGSALGSGLN